MRLSNYMKLDAYKVIEQDMGVHLTALNRNCLYKVVPSNGKQPYYINITLTGLLMLVDIEVIWYLNNEWLMVLFQYDKLIIVCNSVIDDISELNKSLRTCLSLYLSNFGVTIYSLSSTRFSNGLVAVSLVLRRRSNG